jgi:hypothetical protein
LVVGVPKGDLVVGMVCSRCVLSVDVLRGADLVYAPLHSPDVLIGLHDATEPMERMLTGRSLDIGMVTLLADNSRLTLIRIVHRIPAEDQVYLHPQTSPDEYKKTTMFRSCEGEDARSVKFAFAAYPLAYPAHIDSSSSPSTSIMTSRRMDPKPAVTNIHACFPSRSWSRLA